MVSGSSSSCEAGSKSGEQLPTCESSGPLALPFGMYKECCQVSNQSDCTRVCPSVSNGSQNHKYQIVDTEKTGRDGDIPVLGFGGRDVYNCACQKPESLKKLEADYSRWPQSVSSAAALLQNETDFSVSLLQRAADTTLYFQIHVVVILDEAKWTEILTTYNSFTSTALDISSALKKIDKNATSFDMKTILIGVAVVVGIFLLMLVMKRMSGSSSRTRRRSPPSWRDGANRELEQLKRNPRKAKERLDELEEEDE